MSKKEIFTRKRVTGMLSLLIIIALLLGATYAWTNNDWHKTGITSGGEILDVTLNDSFNPPTKWREGDTLDKKVSVTNPNSSTDAVYVRLQFKEYFERYEMEKVTGAGGTTLLFATYATGANKGEFMTWASALASGYNYDRYILIRDDATGALSRGTNPANGSDAYTVPVGYTLIGEFALTKNAEIRDGIYGKEMNVPGNLDIFSNTATPPTKANYPVQDHDIQITAECAYPVHIWDNCNIKEISGTDKIDDYISWGMGADVMTMADWNTAGKPVGNFWVLDTIDGWAYWANPILPGKSTSNIMESITLDNMPGANFEYYIHIDLEAADGSDVDTWKSNASTNGKALIDILSLYPWRDNQDGTFTDLRNNVTVTPPSGGKPGDFGSIFVPSETAPVISNNYFSIVEPISLRIGESHQIKLDFFDGQYNGEIKYFTSDNNAATVDRNGLITVGQNPCTFNIAVILDNGMAQTKLYRVPDLAESSGTNKNLKEINSVSYTIYPNETIRLGVTAVAEDDSTININDLVSVTFAMTNSGGTGSVVSASGIFKAGSNAGIASVTATAKKKDGTTRTCNIQVEVKASIADETVFYTTTADAGQWNNLDPAPAYAGGNGSPTNPYQISSIRQLKKLKNDISTNESSSTYGIYYKLTTDLDFTGDTSLNSSLIGNFSGHFDGDGHSIINANISGLSNVGIFSSLSYGSITDLNREGGSSTSSGNYAGGIVGGHVRYGIISNCSNSATIQATVNSAGGISATSFYNATFYNCYNTGTITANAGNAGGILAEALWSGGNITIDSCYNAGEITAQYRAGGIVGTIAGRSGGPQQKLNLIDVMNFAIVKITLNENRIGAILGGYTDTTAATFDIVIVSSNVKSLSNKVFKNTSTSVSAFVGNDGGAFQQGKVAELSVGMSFDDTIQIPNGFMK